MGKANLGDDFKRDEVPQVIERGCAIAVVSEPLGVSPDSLYAWRKRF